MAYELLAGRGGGGMNDFNCCVVKSVEYKTCMEITKKSLPLQL